MTKLTLGIATKIRQLIQGESLPYGQLKSIVINQMIDNGIVQVKLQGRSRKQIFASKPEAIINYLRNHFGINDLNIYISNLETGTTRAENIVASSDSKTSARRTFKGFLVNCSSPIKATINQQSFTINPTEGTYTYIHDFEAFIIPPETLIIGIENPENFRFINKQASLFEANSILFVSRYPQSRDLIIWLQSIPNRYLHFGDFDFEGIRIFRDEYYQSIKERASFFIPENMEDLLEKYGNKKLYDTQYRSSNSISLSINTDIEELMTMFHKFKRCLEQEVLIELR